MLCVRSHPFTQHADRRSITHAHASSPHLDLSSASRRRLVRPEPRAQPVHSSALMSFRRNVEYAIAWTVIALSLRATYGPDDGFFGSVGRWTTPFEAEMTGAPSTEGGGQSHLRRPLLSSKLQRARRSVSPARGFWRDRHNQTASTTAIETLRARVSLKFEHSEVPFFLLLLMNTVLLGGAHAFSVCKSPLAAIKANRPLLTESRATQRHRRALDHGYARDKMMLRMSKKAAVHSPTRLVANGRQRRRSRE